MRRKKRKVDRLDEENAPRREELSDAAAIYQRNDCEWFETTAANLTSCQWKLDTRPQLAAIGSVDPARAVVACLFATLFVTDAVSKKLFYILFYVWIC